MLFSLTSSLYSIINSNILLSSATLQPFPVSQLRTEWYQIVVDCMHHVHLLNLHQTLPFSISYHWIYVVYFYGPYFSQYARIFVVNITLYPLFPELKTRCTHRNGFPSENSNRYNTSQYVLYFISMANVIRS